jgi:hypothetical protein
MDNAEVPDIDSEAPPPAPGVKPPAPPPGWGTPPQAPYQPQESGSPPPPALPGTARGRRRRWPLVVVLVAVAVVAASLVAVHAAGRKHVGAEPNPGSGGPVAPVPGDSLTLPQRVDDVLNTPRTGEDAVRAYEQLATATAAAAAASGGSAGFYQTVEDDAFYAYRGASTDAVMAANDQALAGQDLVVHAPGSTAPQALGDVNGRFVQLAASSSPLLKIYYVNGVNNTLDYARGTLGQLVQTIGHDVVLHYNPSSTNPVSYRDQWCATAIASLFAEHRNTAMLQALQANNADADAIAASADQSTLSWVYQAVTRSIKGVGRDAVDAVTGKAMSAAEYAAALACKPTDTVAESLHTPAAVVTHIYEWVVNTWEVIQHRALIDRNADQQFDPELVQSIEDDISGGRQVLLIGHSHGTMMARYALQEVNRWLAQDYKPPCPSTDLSNPTTSAPIAALYVSPAWPPTADTQQGYVMLQGDFLSSVGRAAPNVAPSATQATLGPIDRHDMRRYLEPGSPSLAAIQRELGRLIDHVASVPDPTKPCDTTTTETPTTDTSPSTDATPTSDSEPTTSEPPSGPDQTFAGGFIPPEPSTNQGHVTFLTNTISVTVHADGSADGSYSISYTMNDTYLSPDVLPACVETFSASGTLKLAGDAGGTGTIDNLVEATPTAAGCWPNWNWELRSKGGWRLNSFDSGRALGGVDVYGQAFPFNLAGA